MMFVQFAALHGLRIDVPVVGRWVRVPTDDKPMRRNGAYKLLDGIAFVQNHATMTEVAIWRADDAKCKVPAVDIERLKRAEREAAKKRQEAAKRAERIVGQATLETHPYLAAKGFPDAVIYVWNSLAVIPMRCAGQIVGCQMIEANGAKKFLPWQASGGAEFVIGGRGLDVLCEGYATGLSVRAALANLKTRARIHVCFSAGNMARIARGLDGGIVIADNDASGTGERVAREIGWPYWMSDTVGEDANDLHQRIGTYRLAMQMRRLFMAAATGGHMMRGGP